MFRNIADNKYLPLLQTIVFVCGVLAAYLTNSDFLLIESLPKSWQSSFLFKNAFIFDFAFALVFSTLTCHLLFFRTLFASDKNKPRWHLPILRSIDYPWYLGSAYAALLAVAAFQSNFASNSLVEAQGYEEYFQDKLVTQFERLVTLCQDSPAPPGEAASEDLRNAYEIVTNVCAYENAKVEKDGPFYDMTIGRDCNEIASQRRARTSFRTPPESAGYSLDLRIHHEVLSRYEHIRNLCRTQIDVTETRLAIEDLETMIRKSVWWSQDGHEPSHFRWIALLIGLRLVRTTFEFVESARKVRLTARIPRV